MKKEKLTKKELEKFTKKELEEICVKEGIILERKDLFSNNTFFVPNLEKIRIMIREFNFLVDGSSRGKAINEISKVEIFMHENENHPDKQKIMLATTYSQTSIYIESKKDLIADKDSENWKSIFTQYFSLEDIYNYFHKTEGASSFFRKFKIYHEMVDLNFNIKFMDYIQDQIEVFTPFKDNKIIPYKIDSLEMVILIFQKTGLLDTLKVKMKENYYVSAAKLLNTMLGKPTAYWKKIHDILWDIDHNEQDSIVNDSSVTDLLRDVLYHYKIDLR